MRRPPYQDAIESGEMPDYRSIVGGGCLLLCFLGLLLFGWLATPTMGDLHPARVQKVEHDLNVLKGVVEQIKSEKGSYPATISDLQPYLTEYPPLDSWGNAYVYEVRESGYRLLSLGADGKPGGTGEAQDIEVTAE